jgi:hypothetical protein
MRHANEPSIEELKKIQKELFTAESTDLNVKKLRAIEYQLNRLQKEESEKA